MSPLPAGWGWEVPLGLEVGVEPTAATLHLAPCSGSRTVAATPFLPSLLLSTSPDTAPSILTLPSSTP